MYMRVISRRRPGSDVVRDAAILQRTLNRLRGPALVPRGLYRFVTHADADRWMTSQIIATRARLK